MWLATGTFDEYGQPKVTAPPIEIDVRWERCYEEVKDARGNTILIEGWLLVDRVLPVHSIVWLGTLDDWYGENGSGSAGDDTELLKVATYEEIPDAKGRKYERTAKLQRWRDGLPELEG